MGKFITHGYCPVCGPQTFIGTRTFSFLHLLATIFTCGLWIVVWIVAELTKEQPTCSSCGRTYSQGQQLAIHKSKAYEQELERFAQKFERVQELIENLTEEQAANIEAQDLSDALRWDYFDFDPPTFGCVKDMEHCMNEIRMEVNSMLDRLELVLGYRP